MHSPILPQYTTLPDILLALLTTPDPFITWTCAFCTQAPPACQCLSAATNPETTPKTTPQFLKLLTSEAHEVRKLEDACTSYIHALETHVPLGEEFNADQRVKIQRTRRQLTMLGERLEVLARATEILSTVGGDDAKEGLVKEELRTSTDRARAVLANCCGNLRECHICLKLNYTLVADNWMRDGEHGVARGAKEKGMTETTTGSAKRSERAEKRAIVERKRERAWEGEEEEEQEMQRQGRRGSLMQGMWEIEVGA